MKLTCTCLLKSFTMCREVQPRLQVCNTIAVSEGTKCKTESQYIVVKTATQGQQSSATQPRSYSPPPSPKMAFGILIATAARLY